MNCASLTTVTHSLQSLESAEGAVQVHGCNSAEEVVGFRRKKQQLWWTSTGRRLRYLISAYIWDNVSYLWRWVSVTGFIACHPSWCVKSFLSWLHLAVVFWLCSEIQAGLSRYPGSRGRSLDCSCQHTWTHLELQSCRSSSLRQIVVAVSIVIRPTSVPLWFLKTLSVQTYLFPARPAAILD